MFWYSEMVTLNSPDISKNNTGKMSKTSKQPCEETLKEKMNFCMWRLEGNWLGYFLLS